MTGCECEKPGWCRRHGVKKSEVEFNLCQTSDAYFALYEAGNAPMQKMTRARNVTKDAAEYRAQMSSKAPLWEVEFRKRQCEQCDDWEDRRHCCAWVENYCHYLELLASPALACPLNRWEGYPVKWMRTVNMIEDAKKLALRIPEDVQAIVAVPRSGMIPATVVATHLHLPMYVLIGDQIHPLPGGYRSKSLRHGGHVAIIDDSIGSGAAARAIRPVAERLSAFYSVVYCEPTHADLCDAYAELAPVPHLFEWNFFNGPSAPLATIDMDGLICQDFPTCVDDTDENERIHYQTASPLYLPRNINFPVRAIITARPEEHRDVTTEWLQKMGVAYGDLLMWPRSRDERPPIKVAEWKAVEFAHCKASFHVESDMCITRRMRELGVRVLQLDEGVLA